MFKRIKEKCVQVSKGMYDLDEEMEHLSIVQKLKEKMEILQWKILSKIKNSLDELNSKL